MTTQTQTPTAQELIDAGKAVLFMLPTIEQCDFDVIWHEEDQSPEDHFTEPVDILWINVQQKRGNEWAWCMVEVRCKYGSWSNKDYLGGCNYHSKEDFMQEGGCYQDMKQQAYDSMIEDIKKFGSVLDL